MGHVKTRSKIFQIGKSAFLLSQSKTLEWSGRGPAMGGGNDFIKAIVPLKKGKSVEYS